MFECFNIIMFHDRYNYLLLILHNGALIFNTGCLLFISDNIRASLDERWGGVVVCLQNRRSLTEGGGGCVSKVSFCFWSNVFDEGPPIICAALVGC